MNSPALTTAAGPTANQTWRLRIGDNDAGLPQTEAARFIAWMAIPGLERFAIFERANGAREVFHSDCIVRKPETTR